MYQFSGKAQIFNGRYWHAVTVREQATSLPVAVNRAVRKALKAKRKNERITAVSITLERLGKVLSTDEQPNASSSGE